MDWLWQRKQSGKVPTLEQLLHTIRQEMLDLELKLLKQEQAAGQLRMCRNYRSCTDARP